MSRSAARAVKRENGRKFIRDSSGTRGLWGRWQRTNSTIASTTPWPRNPFDSEDPRLFDVSTRAPGPKGALPLTPQMLRERPSGDLFGWTQNAGMGWNPSALGGKEFLMLSTHGGIRAADGTPIALGYHTGHWEVGLLLEAAAGVFKSAGAIPFAGGVYRSVRRPIAGHDGDVRQPAVPERRRHRLPPADSIAADAKRRARRGDVRQGTARDDDGARGESRSARGAGAGRRHAVAGAGRGRGKGSDARRAIRARHGDARRSRRPRMPRVRVARAAGASSSERPRRRRSSAKRWACRSAIRRSRRLGIRSGSTWRAVRPPR